jgi:hypothetical protein
MIPLTHELVEGALPVPASRRVESFEFALSSHSQIPAAFLNLNLIRDQKSIFQLNYFVFSPKLAVSISGSK